MEKNELQGPCPDCGGMFPDLIGHYKTFHAKPDSSQTPTQQMPEWMFQQPEPRVEYIQVPVAQQPQRGTVSRWWNEALPGTEHLRKQGGSCQLCGGRWYEDMVAHQAWHDQQGPVKNWIKSWINH